MWNNRGQYSVDFVIAIGVFILVTTFAFYSAISAFTPHYGRFDIYGCAYRISTLLSEDAGLNLTNIRYNKTTGKYNATLSADWEVNGSINSSSEDWYDAIGKDYEINTTIKRIGLADPYRIYTSYERCNPNVLNKTKVENFFNISWWSASNRFRGQGGEELLRNLSILLTLNSTYYRYNISLRYLNGTVCKCGKSTCQIGYPIPSYGEVAKFERLVVLDREYYECLDKGSMNCLNSTSLRRLVVYVW